jgi:hypothetical protein
MTQQKSSVEYTEAVKPLLKRLTVRDTQKNIVSAGLVAFDRLSIEQKQMALDEANGIEGARLELQNESDTKKLWVEIAKIAKKVGMKIQIPKDVGERNL